MRTPKIIFVTLLSLLTLASCSKEKEEDATLVGRWEMTSQKAEVETNNEVYSKGLEAALDKNSALVSLNFTEDGKVTIRNTAGGYNEYRYSVEGDKLLLTYIHTNELLILQHSISGNTLTIYEDLTQMYQEQMKDQEGFEISKVMAIHKYVKK